VNRLLILLARACAVWFVLFFAAATPRAQQPVATPEAKAKQAPANELDLFMEKVLARREVNRKTLDQYVLDETEAFEILGPGRWPLHRTRRDYTWYVRDGMHVRSPVKFNGVKVGEEARDKYESDWIRRERGRQERKAQEEKEKQKESSEVTVGADGIQVSGSQIVPTEPRFVSEAYFMDFKFEPGNYYLAGREKLDGHDVLKVEYYPTGMFGDSDDQKSAEKKAAQADKPAASEDRARRKEQEAGQDIERRMNKTALITLWIDQAEHQIVKYTFDNVWLDFLPAGWLVKVDDIRASMTMGQPFPGVWLPRDLNIHSGITLASGSFEASYGRQFRDYRLAEVSTRMRVPKKEQDEDDEEEAGHGPFVGSDTTPVQGGGGSDPALARTGVVSDPVLAPTGVVSDPGLAPTGVVSDPQPPQAVEIVGEIRIHGNAFLSDKEVLDLAGIAVGQPLPADGVEAITRRLKDSSRFESVEVRKRYRSLTSASDVALVLVVHEKPGVRSAIGGVQIPGVPDAVARPVGRLRSKLMFLPIISFADGYGFTYGGRVSTVDLLGFGERLSVPLTWGGTRRAALEFERQFKAGPLTRVDSSLVIWNRENPRFETRDQRVEVKGRAERVFADLFRLGADASRSTISFGALDDTLWTVGSTAVIDTRLDPAFPGNAVLATAGWTGMNFRTAPDRINRYTADLRGYLRVFRQVVVAGRGGYVGADATLPPYERLLMGGSSSVRGFRTGSFDGDRTLVTAAELRAPISSVLNGVKLGLTVFLDAGKVWDVGSSFDAAPWRRGAGAGVFLIASIVRINLDVARGLKTGDTRVHLSSGFTF
jgi:hypothetical protein